MKKVFITGVSSGIGKELALEYAKKNTLIGLVARRNDLLNEIAEECNNLGSKTFLYQLDVQDRKQCEKVVKQFLEDAGGIDCVIANAGIGGDDNIFSGSSKSINNILNTNIHGVTNILMPFIPLMKSQNHGYLVCVSSVASYLPLPFHGGYSSSKIAIRRIFDSWRPSLQKHNINLISICPGFIDTPMVKGPARNFPLKKANEAAKNFINAIENKKHNFIYPSYYYLLIWLFTLTPLWFYNWLIKKLFSKPFN